MGVSWMQRLERLQGRNSAEIRVRRSACAGHRPHEIAKVQESMRRSSIGAQCASLLIQEHDGSPSGISVVASVAGQFSCRFRLAVLKRAGCSGERRPVHQQPHPSITHPDRQGQRKQKARATDRTQHPLGSLANRQATRKNAPYGIALDHLNRAPIRKKEGDEIPPRRSDSLPIRAHHAGIQVCRTKSSEGLLRIVSANHERFLIAVLQLPYTESTRS